MLSTPDRKERAAAARERPQRRARDSYTAMLHHPSPELGRWYATSANEILGCGFFISLPAAPPSDPGQPRLLAGKEKHVPLARRSGGFDQRRFLHDRVRVGASERPRNSHQRGAHAHWPVESRSSMDFSEDKGMFAKSISGLGRTKWKVGGICRCSKERKHGLNQPSHPGGGVEVPDVCLHRADGTVASLVHVLLRNALLSDKNRSGRLGPVAAPFSLYIVDVFGADPASASAASTTAACPRALGAACPYPSAPVPQPANPLITA